MIKWLLLVAIAAACAAQDARESRTVQTAQGPVKGYKSDDIFYFYGIPYATAPTGTRKFTAPLPGPVWENTLEATNNKIVCPQVKLQKLDQYNMREDCLVANVYMPDTDETNLSVLVYFHGGAYQLGYGDKSPPIPLVQTKKVVAVTFNYRLGVHGFLCLGTENAPGNAGMKDQVALLRWVKKNIANFRGNPDDVTIAGCSAGSSSVDLLMLSEMAKGLYNKVIPESGASVAAWSVQIDPVQNAKDFAKQLNFTSNDNIKILDDLYSTLAYEALTSDVSIDRRDTTIGFTPCIERDTGVELFLDDSPVNILKKGKYRKVPILYGFANMEGLLRLRQFEQWKDSMNEKFVDFLPADLHFKDNDEKEHVAQEIKKFYFGEKRVSADTFQEFINYFTDAIIAYPTLRSVKLQVEAGSDSIYLYEYSFGRPLPKTFTLPGHKTINGAGHCAQKSVLHGEVNDNTEDFKNLKKNMIEFWMNFITNGKPVPEGSNLPTWPPVGANRSPHMELGKEIKLKGPLLEERARFWDGIYERYYRSPVPPSVSTIESEH